MNLVAGLGQTGQSVMRYLQASGESMLAFDTRSDFDISQLQATYPKVLFATGELPKAWHKWITRVVLSPGICRREAWVLALQERGVEVVGDIELFARAVSQPVVAITGSNGKSTVTTLVGEFLSAAGYRVGVGGNIGRPALDVLLDDCECDVYVLELSSFQLETTYSLHSAASTVLNISEDHMDRYAGLDDYIQAKTNVYSDTELAVVPKGYESSLWLTKQLKKIYFGLELPQADNEYGVLADHNQAWLGRGDQAWLNVNEIALKAPHHQLNALAAMALCEPFDVSVEVFKQVLANFKGLAHRTQLVLEHDGVQWIDDSKGTNVGASLSALQSLGQQVLPAGRIILLAGGVGKGADFSDLKPALQTYARALVLFGRDANIMHQTLANSTDCYLVENLQQAVHQAKKLAKPGDIVLLSPACASFDQFKNYQDRGEQFAAEVKKALGL